MSRSRSPTRRTPASRIPPPEGYLVYIANINPDTDTQRLGNMFGRYGTIYDFHRTSDETATAEYSTKRETNEAITRMNDKKVDGYKLVVSAIPVHSRPAVVAATQEEIDNLSDIMALSDTLTNEEKVLLVKYIAESLV